MEQPVSSLVTLPTEEENRKKAEKLLSEKKLYERATEKWRKEILEIWKAMNGELSANVYPWENPEFIPKMRTEVNFVIPFIFSGEPKMEVTLVGDEDKEFSFLADKILSYRLEKNSSFFKTALAWVTQGTGLGTSMMKVCWKFDKTPKKVIDRPMFSVPNILDVYQNPLVSDTEDQTAVIEHSSVSVQAIRENPAYDEEARNKVKAAKRTKNDPYQASQLDATDLDDVDGMETGLDMVDVYERWSKDRIITVAESSDGPIILRDVENPYGFIPYVKFVFESEIIPNRCNGKGVGQNTLGLQEMYYDLFNMVMLNLKIVVNKMWRVDPGSRVSPSDLIARPGGTIRATKDEAEWVEQTDLKQSGFQMLNLISEEHKRASGAMDIVQGSSSSRTLGQDQLAQSNVSNRFELVRRGLRDALSKVGWMVLTMELQNLQSPDQEIMRIFPESERQNIFEFLIRARENVTFDVKVSGDIAEAPNKDILAKQLLDLYNLVSPNMNPQEQRQFAQEIAKMRGISNVKELIPDFQMPEGMPPATRDIYHAFPGGEAFLNQGQQGPVDGNALSKRAQSPTAEGIMESTYGFERPRI